MDSGRNRDWLQRAMTVALYWQGRPVPTPKLLARQLNLHLGSARRYRIALANARMAAARLRLADKDTANPYDDLPPCVGERYRDTLLDLQRADE